MKRILFVCPGPWDEAWLTRPDVASRLRVERAAEDVWEMPWYRVLLTDPLRYARGIARSHARGGRIDGVIGTGDYPGAMLAASIAAELGLPGPSFAAVVRLSHKVYSREIQRRLVPEATPDFEPLDPSGSPGLRNLAYPCFVKPVKGTMSIYARLVHDRDELGDALRFGLRERLVKRVALLPFERMLRSIGDRRVPAHWFIAEEALSGQQVTVDGFVQGGRATIMGIVDSVMYPGTTSFRRFEYPSRLPATVQERMSDLASRLMSGSGFDDSCFNVEMFYDAGEDRIALIEVNPRMSYQFADLYERVDGVNTHEVQLRLATGEPCSFDHARRLGVAASFVLRRFVDARVRSVPGPEVLAELERRHPGTRVHVLCAPGDRLSDHSQDVGSYRYAIVNMGAATWDDLEAAWEDAQALLRFEFEE